MSYIPMINEKTHDRRKLNHDLPVFPLENKWIALDNIIGSCIENSI